MTPIYTIDAVQSFTFLRRTTINGQNYFKLLFKKLSFALLNGWNVTKTSFDHARTGMESPHETHSDWPLVQKALALIGRTEISLTKSGFRGLGQGSQRHGAYGQNIQEPR